MVAPKIVSLSRLSIVRPAKAIRPLSVLCEQCSLQVWASVSSSQSVGSRPSSAKWSRIARISARLSESWPERLRATRASSSRSRIGTSTLRNSYSRPWPSRSIARGPTIGMLDGVIGQQPRDQPRQRAGRPVNAVGPDGADVGHFVSRVAQQRQRTLGLGIGDARLGQDVHDRRQSVSRDRPAGPTDLDRLDDRIAEDLDGRATRPRPRPARPRAESPGWRGWSRGLRCRARRPRSPGRAPSDRPRRGPA